MKKIKLVIIGATGTAYKRTIPSLKNSDICEIVAIQGRNIDKLKKIQKEFNIKEIYTDKDDMLKKVDYDCIYIATPPFLHIQDIYDASLKSKPIICEKPLAINYEQGVNIVKGLKDHCSYPFMIAHHLRHQKAISDIKDFLNNKLIGEILNVVIEWGFEMNLNATNAVWKVNPTLGGKGTLNDNGIHILDLLLLLFGTPNYIYGKNRKLRTKEIFDDETALLMYNDFCIFLHSSQSMKYPSNNLLIYGSQGSIEVFNGIGEKYIKQVIIKSENINKIIDYKEVDLYREEVENFCMTLLDSKNENQGTTLQEGLDALKIIDIIRDSAQTNTVKKFSYE